MSESDFNEADAIQWLRGRMSELGVTHERGNLINAAAVGITQLVWRNGPIEDAHAGARGRRNGLHDGVMFARNTWVYHQALSALDSPKRYALLEFEDAVLDRDLVWPGTTGTLTQCGYGALGAITKHTKQRINYLRHIQTTQPREEFLLLASHGAVWSHDHFGMPAWESRVRAAERRLHGTDPAFAERLRTVYNRDFASDLDAAPAVVRDDIDEVVRALLNAPCELGAEVLDWLAWNPILDLDD